jgi:hypothetical protein
MEEWSTGKEILLAGNVDDPQSYKTRRGVVGGFKDYLGPADFQYATDALARLDQRFGYAPEANKRAAM